MTHLSNLLENRMIISPLLKRFLREKPRFEMACIAVYAGVSYVYG